MTMRGYKNGITNVEDTPFGYTLSLISGKWKMIILYLLAENQPVRYNELQRHIRNITYRSLSIQLRELEADGLIVRKEFPQVPPRVEYSLSARGESIIPVFELMCEWGMEHQADQVPAVRRSIDDARVEPPEENRTPPASAA